MFFPKPLKILIFTSTAATFILGVLTPFYAIYILKLGGGATLAGLSWGIFHIVSGLLIMKISRFELHVKDRKQFLALGLIIRSVVFLSYAFMGSLTQLFLTQIVWGISTALSLPAFDALYSDHISRSKSVVQWGGLQTWSQISMGLAALFGGIAIDFFGFQVIFLFMAIILLGLGVYIYKLPKEIL